MPRRSRAHPARCAALVIAAATLAAAPSAARADAASDARVEYAAGAAALQKRAYRDAAEHFEAAARLRPHAAAYFAAAKAWQLAGEPVRAADRFSSALERSELGGADKAEAARQLAVLEEKLGTARFTGDGALEARIDDGPPVRPPGVRHGMPGTHTVNVTGNGGTGKIDIKLDAGASVAVDLEPSLVAPKPKPLAERAPEPNASPIEQPPDTPRGSSGLRTGGIVALVGAGVGAGVSIGLGVAALSAKQTFLDRGHTQSDYDAAIRLQTATNVGWVATGVLGAAGATLLVVSFASKPASTGARIELSPVGARFAGRF
jgi:tetratricopeptide (TPR) repeat protein